MRYATIPILHPFAALGEMFMDIGFGRVLEMFEERFGRRPTTALLVLIGMAIAVFCIQVIWGGVNELLMNVLPGIANSGFLKGALYIANILFIIFIVAYVITFLIQFRRINLNLKNLLDRAVELDGKVQKIEKEKKELEKKINVHR